MHPRDRNIGTKNLTVEPTDTISILVHAAAEPPEGKVGAWWGSPHPKPPLSTPLPPALLREGDADSVDVQLQERLWDAGSRPGALWHIFRAEDAIHIRDFLQKVGAITSRSSPGPPYPRLCSPPPPRRTKGRRGQARWSPPAATWTFRCGGGCKRSAG